MTQGKRLLTIVVVAATALMLFGGCMKSALKGNPSSASQSTSSKSQAAKKPTTVYYDFGDVLLPRELKIEKDDSFIMDTPGMTAGVLTLSGGVDARSLTNFFKNKMPADGWEMVSAITSPRTRMLFRKQGRWCVISINEGRLSTLVEIWVSPTIGGSETSTAADTGLIK